MTLTGEKLRELLAKAERARGWDVAELYDDTCAQCEKEGTSEWGISSIDGGYHAQFGDKDQAAFIADANPQTIAALVTELLSLRQRVKDAEEALANVSIGAECASVAVDGVIARTQMGGGKE